LSIKKPDGFLTEKSVEIKKNSNKANLASAFGSRKNTGRQFLKPLSVNNFSSEHDRLTQARKMTPMSVIKFNKRLKDASVIKQREKHILEKDLNKRYHKYGEKFKFVLDIVPDGILPQEIKTEFVNRKNDHIKRTVKVKVHDKEINDLTDQKLFEMLDKEN